MSSSARFERAKRENPLVAVLAVDGIELKKAGKGLVGRCPFHCDDTPSFSVTEAKGGGGLFHCFGCGASGDVISYVQMRDKVSKAEACTRLLRRSHDDRLADRVAPKIARGVTVAVPGPTRSAGPAPAAARPAPPASAAGFTAAGLLRDATAFYRDSLATSAPAMSYLAARGLDDPAVLDRFRVGFASGGLRRAVASDSEQEKGLVELGVLTAKGGELLRGCVTVPLHEGGEIVGLYGRSIERRFHLFLPGPRRGLVNGEALGVYEDLVLVESVFGVLGLFRAGIFNALPSFGVQGWSEAHEAALRESKVRRVIVAFDRDVAGDAGALKVAERLRALGLDVLRLRWPEGMPGKDANDFFTWDLGDGRRPGREDFEKLLAAAEPLGSPAKLVTGGAPASVAPAAEVAAAENRAGAPVAAPSVAQVPAAGLAREGEFENLVSIDEERAIFAFPDVLYTLVGLDRASRDSMRVVVTADSAAGKSHTDRLDLYLSRSRRGYALALHARLELHPARVEDDLVAMLRTLAELHRRKRDAISAAPPVPPMTPEDEKEAMELLQAPDLLDRVGEAFDALGYVGEHANRVLSYLVGTSRLMEKPLSLIVRSSSAAGKSDLLEKTAQLMPPEEVDFLSRITTAALYYVDAHHLEHHLLCFDERTGSSEADYAIRSLQSRRQLSVAVPIKTPSGALRTRMITVYGPTAIMEATTGEVFDENSNRCLEAFLDESAEATRRIHAYQRAAWTHAGRNGDGDRVRIVRRFQNAQRLLRRVTVQIPFADRIGFPAEWIRTRRDHDRFLALVGASAFLHQHQRERLAGEPPVVLAALADYAVAYGLAHRSIGSALSDLPAPTARLLDLLRDRVERIAREQRVDPSEVSFRRRDVREWTRLPDHVVKRGMRSIEDLEYIETTRKGRGAGHRYRLLDAPPSRRTFEDLTTPEDLAQILGQPILNDLRRKWDTSGTLPAASHKPLAPSG